MSNSWVGPPGFSAKRENVGGKPLLMPLPHAISERSSLSESKILLPNAIGQVPNAGGNQVQDGKRPSRFFGRSRVEPIAAAQPIYELYFNKSSWDARHHRWGNKNKFKDNYIRTTKYTVWSFLPMILFFQVRLPGDSAFLIAPSGCFCFGLPKQA
jgi:hypothetical protein